MGLQIQKLAMADSQFGHTFVELFIVYGQDMAILTGKSHSKEFGPLQSLSIFRTVVWELYVKM